MFVCFDNVFAISFKLWKKEDGPSRPSQRVQGQKTHQDHRMWHPRLAWTGHVRMGRMHAGQTAWRTWAREYLCTQARTRTGYLGLEKNFLGRPLLLDLYTKIELVLYSRMACAASVADACGNIFVSRLRDLREETSSSSIRIISLSTGCLM